MSDDLTPDQLPEPDDQDGSLRDALAELGVTSISTLNDWISTLNLPVKATRNAGKALGQLCSAADIDYIMTKVKQAYDYNLISERANRHTYNLQSPPPKKEKPKGD